MPPPLRGGGIITQPSTTSLPAVMAHTHGDTPFIRVKNGSTCIVALQQQQQNNKFISSRQVQSVKQSEYKQRVLIIAYRRLPESYKLSMLATYNT